MRVASSPMNQTSDLFKLNKMTSWSMLLFRLNLDPRASLLPPALRAASLFTLSQETTGVVVKRRGLRRQVKLNKVSPGVAERLWVQVSHRVPLYSFA